MVGYFKPLQQRIRLLPVDMEVFHDFFENRSMGMLVEIVENKLTCVWFTQYKRITEVNLALRSQIIFSPSLENFRDPDSRFFLLKKHRSVSPKRVVHAVQTACFQFTFRVYVDYGLDKPCYCIFRVSFWCPPSSSFCRAGRCFLLVLP